MTLSEQCIIANLEARGWKYATTTSEVRIFHGSAQDVLRTGSAPVGDPNPQEERRQSAGGGIEGGGRLNLSRRSSRFDSSIGPRVSTGPASRGLRADEALPLFRGEGWIEGSWRREDVMFVASAAMHALAQNAHTQPSCSATIASLGARAVWDPRLDSAKSQVIQHLSETDTSVCLLVRRGKASR